MKFVLFSGFLWLVAIFHLWDHRRFERDVQRYMDGARGGDWREVTAGNGGVALKRAFKITDRGDLLRYTLPVVFLLVWLVVFRYWAPAVLYTAAVFLKWFVAQTRIDAATRQYAIFLLGRRIFGARLD